MGDTRSNERYRKKIQKLEDENAELKAEIIALKNELSTANNRCENMAAESERLQEKAAELHRELQGAIREAREASDASQKLIIECNQMKNKYQKELQKIIGSAKKHLSVPNK